MPLTGSVLSSREKNPKSEIRNPKFTENGTGIPNS